MPYLERSKEIIIFKIQSSSTFVVGGPNILKIYANYPKGSILHSKYSIPTLYNFSYGSPS